MNRPVPEAHITSPPHMVSMPRMALPISSSYCALMLNSPSKVGRRKRLPHQTRMDRPGGLSYLLMPQGSEPQVDAQRHEQGGRDQLRGRLVAVERRADPIFRVPLDQPARRAEHAAERAAGHQSGSDDHAALANAGAALAARAFRALAEEVRQKAAHQRGRV